MEYIQISKLKLNPTNPRVIKDEKFHKLVRSIAHFPAMMSKRGMVVDRDFMALGGNQRKKAVEHILKLPQEDFDQLMSIRPDLIPLWEGLREKQAVPKSWVIDGSDFTEDEMRRFIIADNLEFGDNDWTALSKDWEKEELSDWGLDFPDASEEEAKSNQNEAKEDGYEVPEEIKTDIVLGDLFEIGPHRLLCGDSTDKGSVERLMGGEKADMLTDPPYGININMNMGRLKGQPKRFEEKDWDKSVPDFFYLLDMFDLKIIWGGNYFADRLPITKDWLCWSKKMKGLDFAEFELAWSNAGRNARILEHHWSGEEKLHPTMKPVPVIGWCMEFLKSENIFDPFIGSGSTMVAAHQIGKRCFGIEKDEKYCAVIIDRMLKLDPTLEIKKNGQPYEAPAEIGN